MSHPSPKMPNQPAWIITGPTAGIGHRTALKLLKHGTVVLVGRNRGKLDAVEQEVKAMGGQAVSVVCDLSDVTSARRAAAEIIHLGLPIAGVLNNAGIMPMKPFTSPQGWDGTYATNHLGPFAFTDALVPHLTDGTNVVFIVSAVEDPARKPARIAGFRGSRYISAEASARGEWLPGGSKLPGGDAYATSKQGNLAAVLAFARETPRLRFNAVEPGFCPGSDLGRDANFFLRALSKYLLSPIAPMIKYWSNPKRAAAMISNTLTSPHTGTGALPRREGPADGGVTTGAEHRIPGPCDRRNPRCPGHCAEHRGPLTTDASSRPSTTDPRGPECLRQSGHQDIDKPAGRGDFELVSRADMLSAAAPAHRLEQRAGALPRQQPRPPARRSPPAGPHTLGAATTPA